MRPRRRVKIVRPEQITPDETWAKINGFPEVVEAGMNEAQFQEMCEDIATRYGWLVHHNADSRRSDAGLPDLVMVSPVQADGTTVLALLELKREKTKLRLEQAAWDARLALAATLVTGVLRPSDWHRFVQLSFDPAHATSAATADPEETTTAPT